MASYGTTADARCQYLCHQPPWIAASVFPRPPSLPYNSPRDLPRDPGAHRAAGGSAGAGLAGGRISCWVMSPQARALRRLAVKAEATERGKNTERGRERRATYLLSEGTASRPASRTFKQWPDRKRGVAVKKLGPSPHSLGEGLGRGMRAAQIFKTWLCPSPDPLPANGTRELPPTEFPPRPLPWRRNSAKTQAQTAPEGQR
ncbi:hypothetical protein J2X13_002838 [Aminobacter aminovorans]|nr:hypothetical protein [Aminobacter aminovorans]